MIALLLSSIAALLLGAISGFVVMLLTLKALSSGSAETDTLGLFAAFPAGIIAALATGGLTFAVALKRFRR